MATGVDKEALKGECELNKEDPNEFERNRADRVPALLRARALLNAHENKETEQNRTNMDRNISTDNKSVVGQPEGESVVVKSENKPTADPKKEKTVFDNSKNSEHIKSKESESLQIKDDNTKEVIESYWKKSNVARSVTGAANDVFSDKASTKHQLKTQKKAVDDIMTSLTQIVTDLEVLGVTDTEIEEDYGAVSNLAQYIKDWYYEKYPKPYPGAPSTILTDTTSGYDNVDGVVNQTTFLQETQHRLSLEADMKKRQVQNAEAERMKTVLRKRQMDVEADAEMTELDFEAQKTEIDAEAERKKRQLEIEVKKRKLEAQRAKEAVKLESDLLASDSNLKQLKSELGMVIEEMSNHSVHEGSVKTVNPQHFSGLNPAAQPYSPPLDHVPNPTPQNPINDGYKVFSPVPKVVQNGPLQAARGGHLPSGRREGGASTAAISSTQDVFKSQGMRAPSMRPVYQPVTSSRVGVGPENVGHPIPSTSGPRFPNNTSAAAGLGVGVSSAPFNSAPTKMSESGAMRPGLSSASRLSVSRPTVRVTSSGNSPAITVTSKFTQGRSDSAVELGMEPRPLSQANTMQNNGVMGFPDCGGGAKLPGLDPAVWDGVPHHDVDTGDMIHHNFNGVAETWSQNMNTFGVRPPIMYGQQRMVHSSPVASFTPYREPVAGGYGVRFPGPANYMDPSQEVSGQPQSLPPASASRSNVPEGLGNAAQDVRGDSSMSSPLPESCLADVISRSRLPVQEPSVFSGDPLDFPLWKASFTLLIEKQNISSQEKLLYLRRYVSGKAKEAIDMYFLLEGDDAYDKAFSELKQRFGTSFVTARAFREKLNSWSVIKPKDYLGLRDFADFMKQCLVAKDALGQLDILDDSEFQANILDKLPGWLSLRWKRKAVDIRDSRGRYPNFKELTNFVVLEARVASDPMFAQRSSLSSGASTGISYSKTKAANQSLSTIEVDGRHEKTESGEGPGASNKFLKKCLLCEEDHYLTQCGQFRKMSVEQRQGLVWENKLCLRCAASSHLASKCRFKVRCHCGSTHHETLHGIKAPIRRDRKPYTPTTKTSTMSASPGVNSVCTTCAAQFASSENGPVLQKSDSATTNPDLATKSSGFSSHVVSNSDSKIHSPPTTTMIVPVFVSSEDNPLQEVETYALLDTMSSLSFISESVSERLRVKGASTSLPLNTMTSKSQSMKCQQISGLRVRPKDSARGLMFSKLPPVYTTSCLNINPKTVPTCATASKYPHLAHLSSKLPEYDPNLGAGLLLGYDCPDLLMPLTVIQGSPYAIETKLGWSIVGGVALPAVNSALMTSFSVEQRSDGIDSEPVAFVFRTQIQEPSTTDVLKVMERDFLELETGVKSQEDIKFMQVLSDNLKVNDEGHYEMPLPFRHDNVGLSDNRQCAMKRLMSLKRRLERDASYSGDYCKFMKEIIENGYAELIPECEVSIENRWYIPHHGVYHPKKPGKIRVVFDCAAEYQGVSLNDALLQGPDMLNSLPGVLCRFRKGKVAFACDVEKMFYQFHVTPIHRDYLRFLWWTDGDTSQPIKDYRMRVHVFGAASSPGCANYGLRQIAHDYMHVDVDASEFLRDDFYVDDGLRAADEVNTATRTLSKAREICEKGHLRLHKIISNSEELLGNFPDSERADNTKQNFLKSVQSASIERTLGMQWDTSKDVFVFSSEIAVKPETRRGILSSVASLYDPLGLISPIVLKGKIVLQKACRERVNWDSELPEDLLHSWRSWREELFAMTDLEIPRSFFSVKQDEIAELQLHHFSDASEVGYGQCTYLRIKDVNQQITCNLVMAKSRVSPLKTVTIPRLELQAAVLSVRMSEFLERELKLPAVSHTFWTDSKIVLAYLANQSKRFHVFVANRISQILQHTSMEQWHYVPSSENPADHASRGRTAQELINSSWFTGPDFLHCENVTDFQETDDVAEDVLEVRKCCATSTSSKFTTWEDRFQRFGSKHRLLAAMRVLLLKCMKLKGVVTSPCELRKCAENKIVQLTQRHFFENPSQNDSKALSQLNANLDSQNVWRVMGRLKNVKSRQISTPILLPRDSHFAKLLVHDIHVKAAHAGRTMIIHRVREAGYWIMGVRRVTSAVIGNCVECKRQNAKAENQQMADLPSDRVSESPPFSHCGMDCFGPFTVRENRKTMKRYGLIVTCLASRAIHLEVLEDMSTSSLINGLRKVIAVRGNIRSLRCDRGTNFVGASRELKQAARELEPDVIKRQLLERDCEFHFNPPAASHMGGVWERQIRTVRSVLNGLVKKPDARLTTSSLSTLFYEVMAIVNSRPLSVESLEDPLGPLPLTPNHILTMKSQGILPPPGVFSEADMYCKRQWRKAQFLADEFWRRWRNDYLATLQYRRKWCKRQPNVAVNDVVLLRDENVCRAYWRMGRVKEVFPSKDGLVRSCTVVVPSPGQKYGSKSAKDIQYSEYLRPIHKLTVLVRAD